MEAEGCEVDDLLSYSGRSLVRMSWATWELFPKLAIGIGDAILCLLVSCLCNSRGVYELCIGMWWSWIDDDGRKGLPGEWQPDI